MKLSIRLLTAACLLSSAMASPCTVPLKGCYFRDLKTGVETKLSSHFSFDYVKGSSRNSIRCDPDGHVDEVTFVLGADTHQTWTSPYWLGGGSGDWIEPARLLEFCGTKKFTVKARYYLKDGKCVEDDAKKYKKCTDHGYSLSWCKKKYGRRLKEINARHLVEKDEHSECANSEYDMFLVVRGAHFAGLADGDCPMVAFHSEAYEHDPTLQKVALEVDEEHLADLGEDNKLHLGSKPLSRIVKAFETAPVNKEGVMYDAISNNCVALLRNMADPLEIPVDERMIGFISKKLIEGSSEHIFNMMKESPTMAKLYEGGRRFLKGVTNEELLAKVINLYV